MPNAFNSGALALVASLFIGPLAGGLAGVLVAVAFGGGTTAEQAGGAVALVSSVVVGVATFRLWRRKTMDSSRRHSTASCAGAPRSDVDDDRRPGINLT